MKPGRADGFGAGEAERLQALLARRGNQAAMGYHELAGFLFAVAAAPEPVQPSEWLDLLTEDDPPLFVEEKLFEAALPLLLALEAGIRRDVAGGRPGLPPDCALAATGRANLDGAAPLSRWARGFVDGHDWLAPLWEGEFSPDFDAELTACLVALGFFADPGLAAELHREHAEPGESFDAMADRLLATLPAAMAAYAALAREIGEADDL